MSGVVTREQMVEQSVENFVRELLDARGYTSDKVALVDSFEDLRAMAGLDKTYVAAGFGFDDGGDQAEMGSDLTQRIYTVEFFVFGPTLVWAKNVSSVLKFGLESQQGTLPLYDVGQEAAPEIDRLLLDSVSSERQPIADPEPWQEHVYTVHLKVTDFYYASLV